MVNFKDGDLKAMFLIFIGLILAVTIIVPIANQANAQTNTFDVVNLSVAMPGNDTATDLLGRALVGTGTIFNDTAQGVDDIPANVTLRTAISSTTGLLTVQIFSNGTSTQTGDPFNVTYTYQPDGYIPGSGARSVTNLIVLFAALAALVFVVVILIKHGSFGKMMRSK